MWRKPEENKPLPSTAPPVSPDAPACVTRGIKIKGEISGRENLFFDGELEGKVHIADASFTAGPNARIHAEIVAREIIVRGEVIGTLKAGERVQVWSTGRVTGDMEKRGVVIEEGAVLSGSVKIRQKEQPAQPAPPAARAAGQS